MPTGCVGRSRLLHVWSLPPWQLSQTGIVDRATYVGNDPSAICQAPGCPQEEAGWRPEAGRGMQYNRNNLEPTAAPGQLDRRPCHGFGASAPGPDNLATNRQWSRSPICPTSMINRSHCSVSLGPVPPLASYGPPHSQSSQPQACRDARQPQQARAAEPKCQTASGGFRTLSSARLGPSGRAHKT